MISVDITPMMPNVKVAYRVSDLSQSCAGAVQIVFTLLLCSADHVIFILIEHHVTVFVLGKWDRHSLHGDREFHWERFSKNHLLYQIRKINVVSR